MGVRLIDADALFTTIKARHDMFMDCEYIGDKARRDELGAVMGDIINTPTVENGHDVLELCRMGVIKKFVGKGVVMMNYGWWLDRCEKDGFRIAPTPEQLKEQEPIEAKIMGESKSYGSWWFACGACGHAIDPEDNFCRECGRKVKWDEAD